MKELGGELIFSLLHAAHAVEKRLDEALQKAGLSGPKMGALTVLVRDGEPLTLGELAERLTCVRSNITQLVDRLEADGLVRRVDDAVDRRSKRAAVTPLGRQRHAAGMKRVHELGEELAAALAGIDRGELGRALEALR